MDKGRKDKRKVTKKSLLKKSIKRVFGNRVLYLFLGKYQCGTSKVPIWYKSGSIWYKSCTNLVLQLYQYDIRILLRGGEANGL